MADESAEKVSAEKQSCTFFKKSKGRRNVRKRQAEDSGSDDGEASVVVRKEKKMAGPNPMMQKSEGLKEKRREEDVKVEFKSTRSAMSSGPTDLGATATYELDTDFDRDAQAVYAKALEVNKEIKESGDDKLYRGVNNYMQYYEKKDTVFGNAASGMVRQGPIRAPKNLRATVRWDYQPDICKDYKETGFCGFGDSCKFLHDRSDYKHGWQLDREWEEGNFDKEDPHKYEIHSDEEEDDVPFACIMCRNTFVNPVVTKCNHYFCEKCALQRYKKNSKCFVCNTQTYGVFNPAKEIIKKMKEREAALGSEEPNNEQEPPEEN
ncbi:E3 ubiquitin-protein ligase RNF113A-like [Actinia tenebrosa]|uniref:E3 ubiquitin-protein ligase RNF113A-like n=1 Tax=Actinia tenebrosa TaxID=6105 RepID=A0A6P8HVS8_ACTTE|nr:E3 ubiquitin-protein ligase RNF113A-like [Actinia tenebrosa]